MSLDWIHRGRKPGLLRPPGADRGRSANRNWFRVERWEPDQGAGLLRPNENEWVRARLAEELQRRDALVGTLVTRRGCAATVSSRDAQAQERQVQRRGLGAPCLQRFRPFSAITTAGPASGSAARMPSMGRARPPTNTERSALSRPGAGSLCSYSCPMIIDRDVESAEIEEVFVSRTYFLSPPTVGSSAQGR